MDPQAALDIINDTESHERDRETALDSLATWLRKGGAMPCGLPGKDMHPTLTDEAVETLGNLAASVQVALAYGDASGLDYQGPWMADGEDTPDGYFRFPVPVRCY